MKILKLKKAFLLSLFVCISVYGFSQIQGSVKDTLNQPIAFANVLLMHAKDSSVVSGVMATEEGTYSITEFKPGTYLIGVSLIGYKPAWTSPFEVKSSNDHIHEQAIIVEPDVHQIKDVNVVAKKPIYELKMDRMVVNVENSITSSGNTALEILEKSPGVLVDRQNSSISMAGKGGVQVIINGKQNRMPIEAVMQMLDGMNADNVKRIELITTPPAKYDAEGNAGIINIVLQKSEDFGTNGTFSLGAGMSDREKMNASLNLNHHVEKFNFYGMYNVNFNNQKSNITTYNSFQQGNNSVESYGKSIRSALILYQNIRMGIDYTLSSKTTLSFLTNGYIRDYDMDAYNNINYFTEGVETNLSRLETKELNKWIHGMGNLNLNHRFHEEEVLDFNVDYLNYHNDNPSDFTLENYQSSGDFIDGEDIEITKTTPIDILVGAVDYTNRKNEKIKWELGLKETLTWFTNDVAVKYFRDGRWEYDPELTNKSWLNENISAAYASVNWQMTENTGVTAGLRYEYLNSVLDTEEEKGIVDLHYGKLFPTFYTSHKLNENNTIQFSYSKRIDRPTFNELAPFVTFVTPETFVAGNENLVPAMSDIFRLDYQMKSYILSFSYTNTKNSISRFQPVWSEDGERQYFVSRNMDKSENVSGVLALPVTVTEWWKMQNNISWVWQRLATDYEGTAINYKQNYYNVSTNQSFTISKQVSAEVSGFYRSKSLAGIFVQKPLGRLDLGIQWSSKSQNSRLNLNLSDVFKTQLIKREAKVPELGIDNSFELDFEPRVLRLTFTHNFGNKAIKIRKRNTASEEEQRRVTN
ncbi:TonB-dependent receptor domain-containing protein [Draconibacterium halophilum]|uniref:TonB-dependent receptor n=1 Tax=Draconibacterium halophilum TaxID=2706887 RepID=A0A6C0R937_9BACT|nr:TonB-dependent receptor [Draconibacterium halophilum]QIA06452.1 TonB-dependent receptor [Draconibacterium halophilum]